MSTQALERIASALERIANALETAPDAQYEVAAVHPGGNVTYIETPEGMKEAPRASFG